MKTTTINITDDLRIHKSDPYNWTLQERKTTKKGGERWNPVSYHGNLDTAVLAAHQYLVSNEGEIVASQAADRLLEVCEQVRAALKEAAECQS